MKLILTDASHTSILLGILGFAIALTVLLAFVVAHELVEWWRASMARYRLHNLAANFIRRRKDRKCARNIARSLRSHGFDEISPGRWEKRG